jgi:hypothetical protein
MMEQVFPCSRGVLIGVWFFGSHPDMSSVNQFCSFFSLGELVKNLAVIRARVRSKKLQGQSHSMFDQLWNMRKSERDFVDLCGEGIVIP